MVNRGLTFFFLSIVFTFEIVQALQSQLVRTVHFRVYNSYMSKSRIVYKLLETKYKKKNEKKKEEGINQLLA